ncbi:MAG: sulfate reduction electron transfer complex DsrMKJOP subunit DsrJ [Nitrospirae bacterium]|nr:sulfate reduction electron transfer complex DsrMKJOP subunit DsrJ [Nitrospirota bacterium]
MYNGGKIIIGLLIFVGLVITPFLFSGEKATAKPDPKVNTPEILKLPESERKCIESKEYMRSEHMKLLNQWRDWVVRDANALYTSTTGKQYKMSLQNTCMKCHSNKKDFCDQCHNYTAVKPYCWDCHIEPKEES